MPVIHEDGNYLTEKGRALIAKLMASKSEIQFTRAAVGAGTIPEGMAPKDMTDLSDRRADGLISDISTPVPGEAQLVFQVFSRDVPVGFLASEGAVWAMDPDEGEILYTYIVLANSPEWIRAANDPVQKFAEFTCINIVDAVKVDITMVNPEAIPEDKMVLLAREIAKKIEDELEYPGQIKVNLIRETKAIEYAK